MADGLIFSSPFAAVCPLETVRNCPLEVAEPVAASVGMIGEADRLKAHYFFFVMRKTDSMRVDQKFTDEEFSRKKNRLLSYIYRERLLTTIPTMKIPCVY